MNLKRIRKAIVAGLSAGVAGALTYQQGISWDFSQEHVVGTLGAFVAAAVPAFVLTYRVPNALAADDLPSDAARFGR